MIAYGWLAWLLVFLAYEVPAAIAEWYFQKFRGERRRITLSRNCWKWLGLEKGQEWRPYRRARQACMFVFLQTLAFHIAFAHPGGAWIIATGAPVAGIIAYAVFVEDRRSARFARAEDAEHLRADEEAEKESERDLRDRLRRSWERYDAIKKGGA